MHVIKKIAYVVNLSSSNNDVKPNFALMPSPTSNSCNPLSKVTSISFFRETFHSINDYLKCFTSIGWIDVHELPPRRASSALRDDVASVALKSTPWYYVACFVSSTL